MNNFYSIVLAGALSCVSVSIVAQSEKVSVSGFVYQKTAAGDNDPLPGTIIAVQLPSGKKINGTLAGLDGQFVLNIPVNSTLIFSNMGYVTTKKKVTGTDKKMTIIMDEKNNELAETVVIGYRAQSKADITSAATVIDTKDLPPAPVSNVMEMLQGRVAGLNIQMNNGAPGAAGTYTVRGVSDVSIESSGGQYIMGSSAPLFVVDGIPQEDVGTYDSNGLLSGSGVSPISSVPYEDIATITVLKDAAATAQYGSKGAYGVILITTKRGQSSKPRIDFSMDMKVNLPPRLRDVVVGRAERMQRIQQILQNDTSSYHGYWDVNNNQALSDSLNAYYNNHTDWQGQFYRRTVNQTYNLAVSGGSTKFNYKVNGNYYTENGIIKQTSYDRYGLRTNMGYAPNDKFRLSVSVNATVQKTGNGSGNALAQTGVANGSTASSLLPPPSMYTASSDALGALIVNNDQTGVSYDASLNMDYRLPFNIGWSVTAGYKYSNTELEKFTPSLLDTNNFATLTGSSSNSYRYYGRTSLGYHTQIWLLKMGLTVTAEISSNHSTGNGITLMGIPNDHLWGPLGSYQSSGTAKSSVSDNTISFNVAPSFGIANIKGGADKYVISPTIRPEVNSAYGRGVKWVLNPGLGFRWNFFQEDFFQKLDWKWFDYGDIRVSWGRTVKYRANKYDVWGSYQLGSDTYNGGNSTPIDFGNMPNNNIDPVTTTQWNFGFDLGLFNGRFMMEMNTYYKQVDNNLRSIDLPDHDGFSMVPSTDISIVNYGLEVGLTVKPFRTSKNWDLSCMFNFAINRDVMAKLPNEARQIINSGAKVVNRLGTNTMSNYLFVYKGVYATDTDVPVDPATGKRLRIGSIGGSSVNADDPNYYFKAGDPIWADLNGDYIIDDNDKAIVGNSQPKITGGVAFNVRYKSLSVFTNCSFMMGRDIVNAVLANTFDSYSTPAFTTNTNSTNFDPSWLNSNAALAPISAYNFWTPTNIHADYPNPFDYQHSRVIKPFRADQTLFQEDGSYFKINTVTVSWSLPKKWTKWIGVRNASIRGSINNVYTFSGYSGINPENVNTLGWDTSGGYPNARTFSFGLSIGL